MSKLPQLIVKKGDNYRVDGIYLMKLPDKHHHETKTFKGDDGKNYTLFTSDSMYISDERLKHPIIGEVVAGFGDVCFSPGDRVICEHHTFRDDVTEGFKVFYTMEDGTELFRVMNYEVLAKINEDDSLTPRDKSILCNPVVEKYYDTFLELPDDLVDSRRDLVEIAVVGANSGDEYEVGKYAIIAKDADFILNYGGRSYRKVDVSQDFEVFAIVDSTKWRKSVIYKHHKHKHVQV